MKKKLLATLLTSALIVSSLPMSALAADIGAATGEGTVYSPADIIDVVVPTQFKIAVNPLGVAIKNADFNGNTQILSGTYAIQNRSTVPVALDVTFKVTGDTKAKLDTADVVKTIETTGKDAAGKDPTTAVFSLNVVPTAATQSLTGIAAKAADATDKVRTDDLVSGVKLGKLSTTPISLTGTTGTVVKLMLNAGPYKAVYNATDNKVTYDAPANAAYDTVGFTFTGTTTTNLTFWNAVTTAPKVEATYKLTESTPTTYANTAFSPTSKGVIIETGKSDVTVLKSTGAVTYAVAKATSYTFATKPAITMDKTDTTQVAAKQKVSLLNLKPGSKADSTTEVADFGTYTPDDENGVYTYAVDGAYVKDNIEPGIYQVTVGKQSFLMEVKEK